MNFSLDEEQLMLKKSARNFLEKECPKRLVREMSEDSNGYSTDLWRKMAGLGWMGMVFPERYGGVDSTFLDLTVILEEMGRALVPGPFVPTVVLVGRPIMAAGTEQQKKEFIPGIVSGKTILTLALLESGGGLNPSAISVRSTPFGEDFIVNGTKLFVPDAHVADYILCVTRTGDQAGKDKGITLFLIDSKTIGIQVQVLKTLTGEKMCEVVFNNVKVPRSNMLGKLGQGWQIVQRILDEAAVAECAWMTGGAQWVLETTVEYAKERVAFGKPIGSFQAVAHRCSNMAIEVEGSLSIMRYAAWAISENDPEASITASISKAWCSEAYKHIAGDGIQVHGAIGFAWDHDLSLYFKRAKTSEITFGDGKFHRERVAAYILGDRS